jgi:polar amino acid transport system substrate-binding protein
MAMAAIALPLLSLPGTSLANGVDDIKKRGKLIVGVQAENPPWGFVDGSSQLVGYDIEVANLLGARLGVPVEFVRVTNPNRIAQLQTGKVDVLIAVVGMYPDRAKAVQFSKPYATLQNTIVARKATKIKDYADLKGLRVATAKASAQDTAITKNAPEGTIIQRFDDDAGSIQAFIAGQVDALGGNSTYIASMSKIKPDHDYEYKMVLQTQFQGIAMRLDDKAMLDYMNGFVDAVKASGQLNAISRKWLQADLPEFPAKMEGIPY